MYAPRLSTGFVVAAALVGLGLAALKVQTITPDPVPMKTSTTVLRAAPTGLFGDKITIPSPGRNTVEITKGRGTIVNGFEADEYGALGQRIPVTLLLALEGIRAGKDIVIVLK